MGPATLFNEGQQLIRQGRHQGALERSQQAAAACEARGDVENSLICRCVVGQMLSSQGKDEEAERTLRDAATEARKLDAPLTRCHAFRSLGSVLCVQGKCTEAERELRKAAANDDALARCHAFRSLGDVLRVQGK